MAASDASRTAAFSAPPEPDEEEEEREPADEARSRRWSSTWATKFIVPLFACRLFAPVPSAEELPPSSPPAVKRAAEATVATPHQQRPTTELAARAYPSSIPAAVRARASNAGWGGG